LSSHYYKREIAQELPGKLPSEWHCFTACGIIAITLPSETADGDMSFEPCPRQHYYDSVKYNECPFCPPGGSVAVDETAPVGTESVGVVTPSSDPGRPLELSPSFNPPLGWLVALNGPARGQDFTLRSGLHYLSAAPAMPVFVEGDAEMRREAHAILAYDGESNRLVVRPGTGRALAYRNGEALEAKTALQNGDKITLGQNILIFIALAGDRFRWT
jgi:hypothetical protein